MQKLKSRKLWAAITGVILGVAMAFGLDAGTVNVIAGAVTAVVSVVSYIVTEGRVDAAAVAKTVQIVQEAVDEVTKSE